jgi:hypothetical protein
MKFTLTIELGNAAMLTADDVGRALIEVGHRLKDNLDIAEDMDAFDRSGNARQRKTAGSREQPRSERRTRLLLSPRVGPYQYWRRRLA